MKNKFLSVIILLLATIFTVNATDMNINLFGISKIGDNSIKLKFDTHLSGSGKITGDVKLFKDIEIVNTSKDANFPNKIDISLTKDLKPGNNYNIFSVFGTDGNADFKVEDGLKVSFLTPEKDIKGISKIELIDSKNLVVYFKDNLIGNDFEFKVLENMSIKDLIIDSGSLIINTNSNLENAVKYLLMVMSITDDKSNIYKLNDTIFDFSILQDNSINFTPGNFKETTINSNTDSNTDSNTENNLELTSAGESSSTGSEITTTNTGSENGTGNLENVAMEAKQTPNTGAPTWIILAFTLIITSIFLMTRKSA